MRLAVLVICTMIMASSAALAQPSTTAPPAAQPATGQDPASMPKPDLQRIQSALAKAGYDPGTTDGAWTPQSATALSQFQANRALPSTNGKVDHSVLSALGLNKPQ
jgi:peptidoglycan hydrolase-like protein with peptidoglycan-binding domain